MLKIVRVPEKKMTKAFIDDSRVDALSHVLKRAGVNFKKVENESGAPSLNINIKSAAEFMSIDALEMSNKYSGTVVCNDNDTYDEAVGENEAVRKAMENHHNGFGRAIRRWMNCMVDKLVEIDRTAFIEAATRVVCKDCVKNMGSEE